MNKKASNKQIAKAFRDAVPHLWVGGDEVGTPGGITRYMCYAIAYGSNGGNDWTRAGSAGAQAALDIIHERLDNLITLGSWLIVKHSIHPNSKQLQIHRHAWLQLLIKEFETK